MKEIRPTTFNIDSARRYAELLQDNADKVIKGSLFKPRAVSEILNYLSALSVAKANIWEQIRITYPETKLLKSVALDAVTVSWEIEGVEETTPPLPMKIIQSV